MGELPWMGRFLEDVGHSCNDYADWLADSRGLSARTIKTHRCYGLQFLTWLGNRAAPEHLAELTIEDIDAYFENIEARMEHGGDNLSTSTTVEVRRLSHPDFLIEVEVMAVIPQS